MIKGTIEEEMLKIQKRKNHQESRYILFISLYILIKNSFYHSDATQMLSLQDLEEVFHSLKKAK